MQNMFCIVIKTYYSVYFFSYLCVFRLLVAFERNSRRRIETHTIDYLNLLWQTAYYYLTMLYTMRSESRQRLLREKSHKQHSNKCDEGRNWAQWAQFPYWIVWLLGWKMNAQERANFGGTSRATYVLHGQQTAVCFGNWPNQLNQTNPHRYRLLVLFWKALNRNLCCRRLFFSVSFGETFCL